MNCFVVTWDWMIWSNRAFRFCAERKLAINKYKTSARSILGNNSSVNLCISRTNGRPEALHFNYE
jgi:hypothetical protein